MDKLEYDSEAAVGTIGDFKDVSMQGYHEIGELKYTLKVDTETVIELVVGIETLLDITFIVLQDKQKKKLNITLVPNKGKMLQV